MNWKWNCEGENIQIISSEIILAWENGRQGHDFVEFLISKFLKGLTQSAMYNIRIEQIQKQIQMQGNLSAWKNQPAMDGIWSHSCKGSATQRKELVTKPQIDAWNFMLDLKTYAWQ